MEPVCEKDYDVKDLIDKAKALILKQENDIKDAQAQIDYERSALKDQKNRLHDLEAKFKRDYS